MRSKDEKKTVANRTRAALPCSPRKRVTAGDVARCAGVSQTTVSIVLADRRDIKISEATRDRIKKCAKKLGYLPSLLGEGFLRGRSRIIGVLFLAESYFPLVFCFAGVQARIAQAGYVPITLSSYWKMGQAMKDKEDGSARNDKLSDILRLLGHQVEGLLYFSSDAKHSSECLAELARHHVPAVTLGIDRPASGVDFVGGDDRAIGRMAAEHLLSVGCTSFVFGKDPTLSSLAKSLRESFAARIREAGYACRDLVMEESNPKAWEHGLARVIRPSTGFFAMTENMAALAMRTMLAGGLRIPEDVAVICMGLTEFPKYNLLPISTMNRNSYIIGQTAADLLIRRINGYDGPVQEILIPPSLEIRQSSARCSVERPAGRSSDMAENNIAPPP